LGPHKEKETQKNKKTIVRRKPKKYIAVRRRGSGT
jgi:hypothetical protein